MRQTEDKRATDEQLLLIAIALVNAAQEDGPNFAYEVAAVFEALKQYEETPRGRPSSSSHHLSRTACLLLAPFPFLLSSHPMPWPAAAYPTTIALRDGAEVLVRRLA